MIETNNWKVLSYCEIPEDLTEGHYISENHCDSYVEYTVTPKTEQHKYDDDFGIDNWIIDTYPELVGKTILIHIDY